VQLGEIFMENKKLTEEEIYKIIDEMFNKLSKEAK